MVFNSLYTHPLSRDQYYNILHSAIAVGEYRFARQAALHWQTIYPGDIPIRYLYAQTFLKEGHLQTALSILNELIQLNPEYAEAVIAKLTIELWLHQQKNLEQYSLNFFIQTPLHEKLLQIIG